MLLGFVIVYLVLSLALGIYGGTKVNNSRDFVNAGRHLPISVVVALVFATWFGAETVLGIPGTFVEENLGGLISDPFGATFCLIFFGLFFARPLYRQGLLTIGDFYRNRFGQNVEVAVALAIAISYLGWVSAQITALGLVLNVLTDGAIGMPLGVVIGAAIVLVYTLFGGMWSVAITTFVQMIVIVAGLIWIAVLVSDLTGGVSPVVEHAAAAGKFEFWPELTWASIITFTAGFLTMGIGSIPQQDTFQRANSAKTESIAVWGSILGGIAYLAFAAVPLFLAYAAFIVEPEAMSRISEQDPQMVLPSFIIGHMPLYAQVIFFGALLSVIMSTASGALLAPAVTISENVIRPFIHNKNFNDRQLLWLMRATVLAFGFLVVGYSLWSLQQQTSIHHMVESAYKVTLVMALVPLVAGIYWKRSSNAGAIASIVAGLLVWLPLEFILTDSPIPPHFYGFFAAIIAMIVVSLVIPNKNVPDKTMADPVSES
ncbi:sodium:solute symporter family protein [Pleionea litopenaei]|uniref:Sodium:solute symporter family protein n=1 Tax=Pleionea litopenaei TaxID=3070815 RepID=A0AA51X5L3_9GAMM|nr:sodium:solute symporter family protein [Pleionea sp. HL-JVS1]WMS86093.1 sodium:solute symporter family protein [Pleionea sp. HL-JVS1]